MSCNITQTVMKIEKFEEKNIPSSLLFRQIATGSSGFLGRREGCAEYSVRFIRTER